MKNSNNAFEIDQKYKLIITSDEIDLPEPTRGIIEGMMAVQYYKDFPRESKPFNILDFIQEIEWKWLTKRGTLPKRISKWYYDNYGVKMSDTIASAIGNIVRKDTIPNKEYVFDFTRKFNWHSGEFGDSGSCFWESRDEIRYRMMDDPRFYAIRFFNERKLEPGGICTTMRTQFYKDDTTYCTGFSRAWLLKDKLTKTINNKKEDFPIYILFNGYGMTTPQIASIFASFLGESTKVITVTNNSQVTGGLYVNDVGIMVGDKSTLDPIISYDFGLPAEFDKRNRFAEPIKESKLQPIKEGHFIFHDKNIIPVVDSDGRLMYQQKK